MIKEYSFEAELREEHEEYVSKKEISANYNGTKCPLCGNYVLEASNWQVWCSDWPKCQYKLNLGDN